MSFVVLLPTNYLLQTSSIIDNYHLLKTLFLISSESRGQQASMRVKSSVTVVNLQWDEKCLHVHRLWTEEPVELHLSGLWDLAVAVLAFWSLK